MPWSAASALAVLLAAGNFIGAPAAAAAQQPLRRAFPLARDGAVRVYVAGGTVRVVGVDGDSVVATATVPAGLSFHGGGGARGVKLGIWEEGTTAPAPAAAAARLELRVPRRSRVWVKAAQEADVDVRDVAGGLDLNIVGGRVRVSGSPRDLNVESMDGSVAVVGAPAWLRVKTASGAIELRGAPEDVGLTSVSGPITVEGGRTARGRFETVTGDIRYGGTAEPGGALAFESHSGRVALRLPRALAIDVDVTTILGEIENRLTDARPVVGRGGRGHDLAFAVGGTPAATLTIRSFKGTVTLAADGAGPAKAVGQ